MSQEENELKPLNPETFLESKFSNDESGRTLDKIGTITLSEVLNWMKEYNGFYKYLKKEQSPSLSTPRQITDEEIEKGAEETMPYKSEYDITVFTMGAKWMRDHPTEGENGREKCEHDFSFYHGNTPIDDVYRCKKCGKIEYENPDQG